MWLTLVHIEITYDPAKVASNYSALPSVRNTTNRGYVILDGMVLDVTSYLVTATNIVNVSTTMRSRAPIRLPVDDTENEEGRSMALHSRVGLLFPNLRPCQAALAIIHGLHKGEHPR